MNHASSTKYRDDGPRAAPGWGKGRQELQWQSCGAYTSVSTGTLTHTCPFCGSNQAIQRAAPQDVLRCGPVCDSLQN